MPFSSKSVIAQSMESVLDAIKSKEEVKKFGKDPKSFIKDKLVEAAKTKSIKNCRIFHLYI